MRPSIRMVFGRGYVLQADTPCRADVRAFGYWQSRAQRLLDSTDATLVVLVNRSSNPQIRYRPDSDCIMLVPSSSGRWGKCSLTRKGSMVRPIEQTEVIV